MHQQSRDSYRILKRMWWWLGGPDIIIYERTAKCVDATLNLGMDFGYYSFWISIFSVDQPTTVFIKA